MVLVKPSVKYKDSVIEAFKEFSAEGRRNMPSIAYLKNNFEGYIKYLDKRAGKDIPNIRYWLIDNGVYIGETSIRPKLNESLLEEGGNIGYAIRPSERRKGYGTIILKLALEEVRNIGLDRALLTCDKNNIGSRKIIEANGGILENETIVERKGKKIPKFRFWIRI
jgi:predicted acetyltransferase